MTQSITMPNSNGDTVTDNTQSCLMTPEQIYKKLPKFTVNFHCTLAVFVETSDDIDGFHRQTVLCRYIPQIISANEVEGFFEVDSS